MEGKTIFTLLMEANDISGKATGGNGTPYYFGTDLHDDLDHDYIIANEDTVFEILTDSGNGNVLTDLGIASEVDKIGKGMIVKPKGGKTIKAIKLISGSVTGPL